MKSARSWLAALAALAVWIGAHAAAEERTAPPQWIASWASGQQVPEPRNALPEEDLRDATLRQIVPLTLGGPRLRIRLSNAFGTAPLEVRSVTAALSAAPASARLAAGTLRRVTFGGRDRITIPAGAEYVSDPIALAAPAMSHLAVSLYLPEPPARQTSHPGSRATSHLVHGDHAGAEDLPGAKTIAHWYQLSRVEAESDAHAAAIVVLGDSITDGYGVQPDTDRRWPDHLARRLQANAATQNLAVINVGIGGNRVLLDELGPNALARFERDVLSQPGVKYMIVLEGVNDLGTLTRDAPVGPEAHQALVENLIGGFRQMVARARDRGIVAIGATIPPYGASSYYHPDAANEADRQAVNAFIRAPGSFDAIIDFDTALRDPADPTKMRRALDSGDGLHPSLAGYEAMANLVPLELFAAHWTPLIALTFDDIPVHGPLPDGETRLGAIRSMAAALKEAGVGEAYGFVNAASIAREPELGDTLEAWRSAGYPLGNHGWSHLNLNEVSAEAYIGDIVRNEPPLRRRMRGKDWRWFRYPFLAEGDEAGKRAAVRRTLAQRGYRIAAVTTSFDDYLWNGPYARCRGRNDEASVGELERLYLEAARESIRRDRDLAKRLYGRDIPYVALLHVGAFNARMLPRLLALYREHGFRFVPLAQASADPAYASDVSPASTPEPVGLGARLQARGVAAPPARSFTNTLDGLCR
ncbi:MAG: polysaccharide deacetylase family protein [Hyphomonadaceae bacterium]|nr:polysaccharide deacetylase family protein [Hyphomonadaceae bacterium]